jgi:hypothetical protein
LLVLKIDSIWKHAGRRKALKNIDNEKKGDHYFLTSN